MDDSAANQVSRRPSNTENQAGNLDVIFGTLEWKTVNQNYPLF